MARPFTAPRAPVSQLLLIQQNMAVYALETAHRYTTLCAIRAAHVAAPGFIFVMATVTGIKRAARPADVGNRTCGGSRSEMEGKIRN